MNRNKKTRLIPGQCVTMAGYPGTVKRLYADGPTERARMYEVQLASGLICVCGADLEAVPPLILHRKI
ncbi:MAG TPA: hypothetical protein VEC37_02850 [Bacillota bacterium]|nr:hypothetical protein [Bacillota bacterium]